MTDYEKKRITELRGKGFSYNSIGIELGLPTGTVKMFCIRNGLGGKRSPAVTNSIRQVSCCEQCGKPVVQVEHRKHKRFCSTDCRTKWWTAHRGEVRQKTMHTFICRNCGNTFSVYGETDRAFCSRKCFAEFRSSDGGLHDAGF